MVQPLQLGGQLGGARRVARAEKFNHLRGHVHAPRGIDARRQPERDIEAGDFLSRGIEAGGGKQRAQTGARGAAELAQSKCRDRAVFAAQRHGVGNGGDGCHLQKAGQSLFAGALGIAPFEQGLRELERNGRAAQRFFRVSAAGLIGIENRQRRRHRVARLRQMVVGDDEIEPESLRRLGLGKSSHSGVDRDGQAHAVGVCRFEHARLHAIALAQPVRHMKTDYATKHFNGGLEQHDSRGAVHVVIAIEQHRLFGRDGSLQPRDGRNHSQHEEGIVELSGFRIQESRGLGSLGNSAGHQ